MDATWTEAAGAVVVAALGGGGFASWVTARSNRKKVAAEATDVLTQAAERLADSMRSEIDRLTVQIGVLREETEACEHRANGLAIELGKMRVEVAHRSADIDTLKVQLAARDQVIGQLQAEIADLRARH